MPRKSKKKKPVKPDGYIFGRPTKYHKKYCENLIEHQAGGGTFNSFPGYLWHKHKIHVCRDTLYEWCKKQPDFSYTRKVAQDLCVMWWELQGRQQIVNRNDSFPQSLYIFTMKNIAGWRDKVDLEHSGPGGKAIEIEHKKKNLRAILKNEELADAAVIIARKLNEQSSDS